MIIYEILNLSVINLIRTLEKNSIFAIIKRSSSIKTLIVLAKFYFFLLLFSLFSCASKKDILYINSNSTSLKSDFSWPEIYIQPNDIIDVKVTAEDPLLAAAYNIRPLQQNNIQSEQLQLQGYIVANEGYINIPVLGLQKIIGLTLEQAEKQIQEALVNRGYLINPVVVCRLLNAKFTVLGEVKNPGTFIFYEKNLTLLQALGLAGDLTINGVRKKITIIRTENGEQSFGTIDLTKKDWFATPYYFVKPNDVIIVDPNTARVQSSGVIGNPGNVISIVSALLSSIIVIKSF